MTGPFGSRHSSGGDTDMIEVMLLGKPDCGLCDEVDELLFDISLHLPLAILKVDITEDAELLETYGEVIPVVRFPSERELRAPIDPTALRRAIEAELAEG